MFFALAGADSNDALEEIEREIAPILARERNAILLDDALFARIEALHAARRELGSTPKPRAFSTATARLSCARAPGSRRRRRARLAAIGERLATLGAEFGQNVLADEKAFVDDPRRPRRSRRPARELPRRRGARGGRARLSRQARGDAFALLGRAVPAILGAARSAREGLSRLCSRAAPTAARTTTARS